MTPSDLDQRLAALRQKIAARPSMAPAVVRRTATIQMTAASSFQFRRFFMRASIGLAACAAVAIVAVILLTDSTTAFSQVLEKIDHTKTLTCDTQDSFDDQPGIETLHVTVSGDRLRIEQPTGRIYIKDSATGESLTLDTASKSAYKSKEKPGYIFDFYGLLRNFRDGKEELLGEKEINGQKVTGYKVTKPLSRTNAFVMTMWVNPTTNLPVEVEGHVGQEHFHVTNMTFDQPLKEELFAMTLPEGWQWVDPAWADQGKLSAPPTTQESQALVLIAGKGLGQLNLGDPTSRVLEILGKPEHEVIYGSPKTTASNTQPAAFYRHVMSYPSKGLEITLAKGTNSDIVDSIRANSKASSGGSPINDFPGKTDHGIAIGATPDQIKAAYGEPAKTSTPYGSFTLMEYDGINFSLIDEKVIAIAIIPRSPKK